MPTMKDDQATPEQGRHANSLKQGTAEPGPPADGEGRVTSAYVARVRNPVHFKTTHQARFEEIDPFGHMNTNHYLTYFMEHRWIGHRQSLNLDLKGMMRFPVEPHVRKADIEFIKPVMGDQEFTVESWLSEAEEGACTVSCTMVNANDTLLATCKFYIVCVEKKTRKPSKWPETLLRLYYHELAPE